MSLVIFILIVFWWILLGIFSSLYFMEMLNVLVKNGVGSYSFCYFKLGLSLRFFKNFINENNFAVEQKERFMVLYKRGKFMKIFTCVLFLVIVILFYFF